MKMTLMIAILSLVVLPVLAAEPVDLSGPLGEVWLKIPANTEQDLWSWGSTPNYYLNETNESHYYAGWYPYLYYASGHVIYVSGGFYTPYSYPYYTSLPPTSFYIYYVPQ